MGNGNMKVELKLDKNIKVVELDSNKTYAIIFPDYTDKGDFIDAVNKIREMGLDKVIAVHKNSDTKFKELKDV